MIITLHGSVPSKKNLLRRGRGSHLYRDKNVQESIEWLTTQAWQQWGESRRPLEHPDIAVRFFVRSRRSDRDNKLTCLLDCLQAAGVIHQDNIKWFNGTVTILPAVVSDREMTIVEIREQAASN